jgi:CubicO group peptidase (beta-lactamase class C family)
VLIDRGKVELDAPIATYWPEFAQNGKEGVTVKHVLGHLCGVIFADAAKPGDWFDYPAQVAAIEVAEPAWPPETKGAYNSINIGFILGEVVRRVSGRTVGQFLREEITEPLGAEYNIGITKDEVALVAPMHENPANKFWSQGAEKGSNLHRAWAGRPLVDDMLNRPEIREGELPSFGGHGNARGMATIYAMLAGDGEVNGVRLLKPETVVRLSELQWEGICGMTGWPMRMGLGYMHNSPPYIPMGTNMQAFGHLGSGGALGFCDRQANLSFSYATNFQCTGAGEGDRCQSLVEAAVGYAPEWQPAAAE